MTDSRIAELLHGLESRDPQPAWNSFLESYSDLISQVVRWFERGDDESANCFVYVCEQLGRNQFRRLRRFNPAGPACFPTWLRAVVRNLCLDWQRRQHGRYRTFRFVTKLPKFDQEVFHNICERNLSVDECAAALQDRFPGTSVREVGSSLEQLRKEFSPHQNWLLFSRRTWVESLVEDCKGEWTDREIVDKSTDPEAQTAQKEELELLHRAMDKLPKEDVLLLELRFEQELSLDAVAKLLLLKDAAAAQRRIREALTKIRGLLGTKSKVIEKAEARSV